MGLTLKKKMSRVFFFQLNIQSSFFFWIPHRSPPPAPSPFTNSPFITSFCPLILMLLPSFLSRHAVLPLWCLTPAQAHLLKLGWDNWQSCSHKLTTLVIPWETFYVLCIKSTPPPASHRPTLPHPYAAPLLFFWAQLSAPHPHIHPFFCWSFSPPCLSLHIWTFLPTLHSSSYLQRWMQRHLHPVSSSASQLTGPIGRIMNYPERQLRTCESELFSGVDISQHRSLEGFLFYRFSWLSNCHWFSSPQYVAVYFRKQGEQNALQLACIRWRQPSPGSHWVYLDLVGMYIEPTDLLNDGLCCQVRAETSKPSPQTCVFKSCHFLFHFWSLFRGRTLPFLIFKITRQHEDVVGM